MRFSIVLTVLLWAASAAADTAAFVTATNISEASVRAHMEFLAGDALNGRASGSTDEWIAATYIASQLRRCGAEPLGDAVNGVRGFIQTVQVNSKRGTGNTWNVVGRITGSDARRGEEAILISAHLDHLGSRAEGEDRIFNGADDDASGTTAVLTLAEALAKGDRPRRTIVFALFGSEEVGGFGARWFVEHPPVPLGRIIANLEFEMIGRPDAKVAAKTLWLTGWERSNLGPELAKQGARLVADPHPQENFFMRSDNITLARLGVVAQTVSSYGLHDDYHRPSDDVAHIDFAHMTEAIQSMLAPIRWLADSTFKPQWVEGKRP